MLPNHDLGASLYKTWSDYQKREEIGRLVEGYRNGIPVGILCKMVETVAGSKKKARRFLQDFMTPDERKAAIAGESGAVGIIVRDLMK